MSETSNRDEGCDDEEIKNFLSNAEVTIAPSVKWEDVYGIKEAADRMKECIVLPAKFPHLFQGIRTHLGYLIYGAPGTGKTLLVNAMVAELIPCNVFCFKISAYDFLSRLQKNPIKSLQAMFKKAAEYKHCVMFIDDIEVLSENDTEMSRNMRIEFFKQVNNMPKEYPDGRFAIVGISNKPWKLQEDYALRRILSVRVYAPLPDFEARCAIFKRGLPLGQHSLSEEHFRLVGEMSEGFSGSDIVVTVKDALMEPVRKIAVSTHFKYVSGPSPQDPNQTDNDLLSPCSKDDPDGIEMEWSQIDPNKLPTPIVTVDDVMKSVSKCKPSVSQECLEMYQRFTDAWVTV